jgi:hypothetical protein
MIVIYVNCYIKRAFRGSWSLAASDAEPTIAAPFPTLARIEHLTLYPLHISIIYNLKGHGNEIFPL